MTINEFKKEFRIMCTDTLYDSIEAWFECAGRMNRRGMDIPDEWEYSPGMGDGTDKDSYWYSLFARCGNKQLQAIGNLLFRYCQYLKYKGLEQ